MNRRTICAAIAALAFALCTTLTSPARAQIGVPDSPGHGSAVQVPAGNPADMLSSSGLQPLFLGGISRMAMAVSSWRIAPSLHSATTIRGRSLGRTARASR